MKLKQENQKEIETGKPERKLKQEKQNGNKKTRKIIK